MPTVKKVAKKRVAERFRRSPVRNFSLYISPKRKAELKVYARKSGISLTAYVQAALSVAIEEKHMFKLVAVRVHENT